MQYCLSALVVAAMVRTALAAERTEQFNRDPQWHGHNNRIMAAPRMVKQDFGFSDTSHAGGERGELGGFITPCGEPASYAKIIETTTLNDTLSASGNLVCPSPAFNALIGFFNANTVNEWRTANTIVLRVYGRGEGFYVYVEYCTGKWRAGASTFGVVDREKDRFHEKTFPGGNRVHTWSLRYDPMANNGTGAVFATFDGEEVVLNLDPGHKADGAAFNRFGLLNVVKSYDGGGELWLDDLTVQDARETFAQDPHWDGLRNRTEYPSRLVRPWFDFGFSNTHHAGGAAPGEMGGVVFRGDGRDTNKLGFYGAPTELLDLARPLRASGKVALRRAVSDSDTLIGFFHAEHSLHSGGSDRFSIPPDFLGVAVGGPSREGFFFAPACRMHASDPQTASRGPYIYPNGDSHDWSLEFIPGAAPGGGRINVRLGNHSASLDLTGVEKSHAHFNRFGIITTHTDGNVQEIYFDDLTFTIRQ